MTEAVKEGVNPDDLLRAVQAYATERGVYPVKRLFLG